MNSILRLRLFCMLYLNDILVMNTNILFQKQTITVNPRSPKGYWSHTKPQGGPKRPYKKHRLYELAQMFSVFDLFFSL